MTTGGTVTQRSTDRPHTLRELREAANLTRSEVAQRMGVNRQRVGHIEAKYPAVTYSVLRRYIEALGGWIRIDVAGLQMNLDELNPDPSLQRTRDYLLDKNDQWLQRLNEQRKLGALPEELVLQGDQAEPGSDDTGGQVDHPDAQSDQGDSDESQQP